MDVIREFGRKLANLEHDRQDAAHNVAEDVHDGLYVHPTIKVHTTVRTGTVGAAVDEVWPLVRDFSGWAAWWPLVTSSAGAPDADAAVRQVSYATGRRYTERQTHVDDGRHVLGYSLMNADEFGMASVKAQVELTPAAGGSTTVVWSNYFQPTAEEGAAAFAAEQGTLYEAGIRSLAARFVELHHGPPVHVRVANVAVADGAPPLGRLTLTVDGVLVGVLPLSPAGTVTATAPTVIQTTTVAHTLTLEAAGPDGGAAVGAGSLPTAALYADTPDAEVNHTVELRSAAGDAVATYNVSVISKPPPSMAQQAMMLLHVAAADMQQQLAGTIMRVGHEAPKWAYKEYGITVAGTPAGGSAAKGDSPMLPLPKHCAILPPSEAMSPRRIGELVGRSATFLYAVAPPLMKLLVGVESVPEAARPAFKALKAEQFSRFKADPYALTFAGGVPRPDHVIRHWMEDEELAAQMIRGVNPMKLTRVTGSPTDVLPACFHGLLAPDGRDVAALTADRSLFYADYEELAVAACDPETGAYHHHAFSTVLKGQVGGDKYWYAPRVVVYKTIAGKLSLLGFTLTRKGDGDEVYTAATHPSNVYKLAKLHLSCADSQSHEFVSHLGMTHLLAEPIIVATHNALPADHIVRRLLQPHFVDTIGINFLARQTLVSPVAPFTDATLATGTHAGLAVYSSAYAKWDFLGDNFVNSLAKRGFTADASVDGLDGFHYRDDGFKVWNIFTRHIAGVLTEYYGAGGRDADAAVAADESVAAWCAELRDPAAAALPSFPAAFFTVATLTEALVTITFTCSAQHAAVNFPQEHYITYVLNRPGLMASPMPPTPWGSDIPAKAITDALPGMAVSLFQALFGFMLSSPTENPAAAYSALADDYPAAVGAFAADLRRLRREIADRNAALVAAGEPPYPYLSPENMPLSIDI